MPIQAVIKGISIGFKIALAIGIVLIILAIVLGGLGFNEIIQKKEGSSKIAYFVSGAVIGLIGAGITWYTYKGFLGRVIANSVVAAKITASAVKFAGQKAINIGKSVMKKPETATVGKS